MTSGQEGDSDLRQIAKLLTEDKSFVIALPTQATLDSIAAGLALYGVLSEQNKKVYIAIPQLPEEPFDLPHEDALSTSMSTEGNDLLVKIPFKKGVENVTYNVEDDVVNIHIESVPGGGRFDKNLVDYSFVGGKADVVIALYAPNPQAFGTLFEQNQEQFENGTVVNIDRHFTNASFGTLNYVDKRSPAMSQMVNDILREMKVDVSQNVATLLYAGLADATKNFSAHTVNSNTFRAAAFFLDKGATRRSTRPSMIKRPIGQGMPPGGPSVESLSELFKKRQQRQGGGQGGFPLPTQSQTTRMNATTDDTQMEQSTRQTPTPSESQEDRQKAMKQSLDNIREIQSQASHDPISQTHYVPEPIEESQAPKNDDLNPLKPNIFQGKPSLNKG